MRTFIPSLLALSLSASTVAAQTTSESFQAETLRPASDREGIIDVESGSVAGHLEYDVALWLGYANRPFRVAIVDADGSISDRPGAIVAHRFGMNLVGQIALFEWVQIGADLAVVPLQLGGFPNESDYAFFGSNVPAIAGLGDLRLIPKVRVLREEDQFVNLAIIPAFTVPTGLPFDGYLGEGMFTFVPEVAVSKEIWRLNLAANLGFRFRLPRQVLNTELGQEIYFRGGAGYSLKDIGVPLGVQASINAATRMFSTTGDFRVGSRYHNRVETNFQATYDIWRMQVFAGPGFGLWRGAGTPNFRIFGGVRYAPRADGKEEVATPVDSDKDGVNDDVDTCPNDPEDPDGFEDTDGCPDADNDGDGLNDGDDDCPLDSGPIDNRGCPVRDFDGDGVPDASDKCPEAQGPADKQGCPIKDTDGDGTADDGDKCPDQKGPPERGGCPIADKDADGVPDAEDTCPEVAGPVERQGCPLNDKDLDGVTDDVDKCPEEKGPATAEGCPIPDKDGDSVEDKVDACPEQAGPPALKGCPDRDGDGVTDATDKCPDAPGLGMFEGCGDKDKDGVADNVDKCPDEPEVINGVKDDDGCPDEGKQIVIVTKEKIEIGEKVYFDTGSARIQERSFGLLDQVAQVLKANAQIEKVRVEGHTDSVGSDETNMTLSQGRAESVMKYLTDKGVDASRLQAQGFGETKPISDNGTKEGRANNRRVEFVIVEQ